MYFLDSDILTAYLEGDSRVVEHVHSVPWQEVTLSMLTVDEALQGYLSVIHKFRADPLQTEIAYGSLQRFLKALSVFPATNYPKAAEIRYVSFSAASKRIGAFDCRLVAHAVIEQGTVVTRNLRDFEKIRDNEELVELRIENWMDE